MWRKILIMCLSGVLIAGEFFVVNLNKKSLNKASFIPLQKIKKKMQLIYDNPVLQRWGQGAGIAAVLGPADTPGIDWGTVLGYSGEIYYNVWNNYDPSQTIYLTGIDPLDTAASYFQPPAACTIVAFGLYCYNSDSSTHFLQYFATWFIPGIDYQPYSYITSPTVISIPGQTVSSYVFYPDSGVIDNVTAAKFWTGWTAVDYSLYMLITAGYGNEHSWLFSYLHDLWSPSLNGFWMDAFVWIYEDPPPSIVWVEEKNTTFSTGPFKIQAQIKDAFGVPSENQGVRACTLEVYAIPSSPTPQYIPGVLVSGDSTDGIWEFTLGTFNPNDTVYYRVYSAYDYSGEVTGETTYKKFIILEYNPQDQFLFIDEDQSAWAQYAYEIFNTLADYTDSVADGVPSVFFWDTKTLGLPDSTVLDVNKFKAVFWTAWQGEIFASDTVNIKNYLDSGGKLLISSQDLVVGGFGIGDWTTEINIKNDYPNHFLHTYLKMGNVLDDFIGGVRSSNYDTVNAFYGFPGDTISNLWGIGDSLLYYGFLGYNFAGYVFPDDLGDGIYDTLFPCFFYEKGVWDREIGTPSAYWYDGPLYGDPYKLVLFYWNYQYLVDSVEYDATGNVSYYVFDSKRLTELTKRILNFFGYNTTSVIEIPKPANLNLSIKAPSIAGLGKVTVFYTIPEAGEAKICMFDVTGRLVKTLFKGRKKEGAYAISFTSSGLKPGTYFIKVELERKRSKICKIIFIK